MNGGRPSFVGLPGSAKKLNVVMPMPFLEEYPHKYPPFIPTSAVHATNATV